MLFYLFKPKQAILEWLATIEWQGDWPGKPIAYHNGHGIVLKRGGYYLVYYINNFIKIEPSQPAMMLNGQGKGVRATTSLFTFTNWLIFGVKEN